MDTDDFLAHYGVKGMRWGTTKKAIDSEEGEGGAGGELGVEDIDDFRSGDLRTTNTVGTIGGVIKTSHTTHLRGSAERFLNKFFDRKVTVKRGSNWRTETRQGSIGKFFDKMFKQKAKPSKSQLNAALGVAVDKAYKKSNK